MGLFKTTNITTRADKISSFNIATAEFGAPVPEILGTTRISGNVLYYDDFTAHEHRGHIAPAKAAVANRPLSHTPTL